MEMSDQVERLLLASRNGDLLLVTVSLFSEAFKNTFLVCVLQIAQL